MFICEDCRDENVCHGLHAISYGACEVCGKVGPCLDCHCRAKVEEEEE